MSFPTPWGAYIAGHTSNTSTSIYDFTGNGRNATISGTAITSTSASGNGASASIPYFTGTTTTEITWPSGSIPTTFTICSITRYNGSNKQRILTSLGSTNNIHGHWNGYSGVAYYDGWKSPSSQPSTQPSYVGQNNWVVMCGTNSTGIAVPNNISVNGTAAGGVNGGAGGIQLSINSNQFNEDSDFAFNHVLIWNQALTTTQMQTVSTTLLNYLSNGTIQYPWLVYSTNIPTPWGAYIAGDSNNTAYSLYDFTGNERHATITGTITNVTGSGNGALASIPYITGTTATKIDWPSGSVPTTFTICSITRYNGGNRQRILDSTSGTVLHGHWFGKSGVAYYGGFKTTNTQSTAVGLNDWVVMCGTNDLTISTPNNIIINGTESGASNGGSGGVTLQINRDESSDFAFQQVLIWDIGLTTTQMQTISRYLLNYLSTRSISYPWVNNIANIPVYFPIPWGAYIAGHASNTSTSLYDFTGNGRNATIGGTSIVTGTTSGNGASASIPYFTGTTGTTITWPSGSIPTTFTICSITRYSSIPTTTYARVLNGSTNFIHGHYKSIVGTYTGVAYYEGWETLDNNTVLSTVTDWLVMCGTNGTSNVTNATPNNILANGTSVGNSNGGTGGGGYLTINTGLFPEPSNFAFNQVIIWDQALTNTQLASVSSAFMNYLSSGIMSYPWLQLPKGTICYYNFSYAAGYNLLNVSNGTYDLTTTGNGVFSLLPYKKFRYLALYRSIVDSSVGQNYLSTSKTIGSSFTVAFWFKTVGGSAANTVIKLNKSLQYINFYLANGSGSSLGNLIKMRILNDNTDYNIFLKTTGLSAGITWNANDWNHVALIASYNGTITSIDVYYNGSLVNYEFQSQSGYNTSTNKVTAPTSSTDSVKVTGTVYSSDVVDVYIMGEPGAVGVPCYLSNLFIINNAITKSDLSKLIKYNYVIDTETKFLYRSNDIANSTYLLQNNFNNGFNQTYYLTNSNSNLNKLMLYVYGTRTNSSPVFKINGVDIIKYFQQDSVTYADELGNYTLSPWGTQNARFKYARWIWNDPNAASTASANINLWFYYTFYYSGASNTGTVYGMCDNVANFWFNGTSIGSIGGGWATGSNGTSYSISIVNGLNYIRVAAYNDGTGAAGLLVTLYDSGGNHITSSSRDWVVTTSSSYNTGAYTFNLAPGENISVNLVLSGSYYSNQVPVTVADVVTGEPIGTTFSPTTISTPGTYTLSTNITVTLPSGYTAGNYSGTLTILNTITTNLTLSGNSYYLAGTNVSILSSPSIAVSSLVTSSPSVIVTYSPTNFTTSGLITSLSGITPSFPSGYSLGTVSGTASIIPYLDFTATTGSTVSIPSWCKKVQYVIQNPGTSSSSTTTEGRYSTYTRRYTMPGLMEPGYTRYTSFTVGVGETVIVYYYNNFVPGSTTITNGTGGSCVYGTYNNSSNSANAITVMNTDSSRYIQFNDTSSSNTNSGSTLLTRTLQNGSGTNPGSSLVTTFPVGASNISAIYGAGGTTGNGNDGGPKFIRIWFMT